MNDRPTPETDAFSTQLKTICGQKKWVPVAFSRKLERERDEAREQIAKLLNKLDQLYRDVEIDKLKEDAK